MNAEQGVTSPEARRLLRDALVCDMTVPTMTGIPGQSDSFPEGIGLYIRAGCDFVSLTCRGEVHSVESHIQWLAGARKFYSSDPDRFALADTADDILRARQAGKLAVAFNLQGGNALLANLDLVETYRRLGVGHLEPAYNTRNAFCDGCYDEDDAGLSPLGRELIKEMNRVGMIVDCSHLSRRASMEIMELSADPVIFSHSNPRPLFDHPRNIMPEQATGCAQTGGVVGVVGVGQFMSTDGQDVSAEMLFRQVDYYVERIGPEHVGLGLDYVHDIDAVIRVIRASAATWPGGGYDRPEDHRYASPLAIPRLVQLMLDAGYGEADVEAILGTNWLRVMREVWGR